jgi:shikimate kinase
VGARPERIVLIGLRRSGKTTAGGLVAERLGWTSIDTDEVVEKMTGRTSADWIRDAGEGAFRDAEEAAVTSIAGVRGAVIATGGGAPLSQKNRENLRDSALIAYLRADPWVLAARARADVRREARPPLGAGRPDEEDFILFAERDGLYRSFCDVLVDASAPPAEVASAILAHLDRILQR